MITITNLTKRPRFSKLNSLCALPLTCFHLFCFHLWSSWLLPAEVSTPHNFRCLYRRHGFHYLYQFGGFRNDWMHVLSDWKISMHNLQEDSLTVARLTWQEPFTWESQQNIRRCASPECCRYLLYHIIYIVFIISFIPSHNLESECKSCPMWSIFVDAQGTKCCEINRNMRSWYQNDINEHRYLS